MSRYTRPTSDDVTTGVELLYDHTLTAAIPAGVYVSCTVSPGTGVKLERDGAGTCCYVVAVAFNWKQSEYQRGVSRREAGRQ